VSLSSDNHFHQMVWEQTSSTVLDTVQQLVGQQNRTVDVEVTYSECWDTYRAGLLRILNRKYTEIVQDIRRVDATEAELCVRGHINEVENNLFLTEERKSWIVSYLQQNV
jgi:DNA-binding FadR family transcriptional regulator